MQDTQRKMVYRAEQLLRSQLDREPGKERRFEDLAQVRGYLQKLCRQLGVETPGVTTRRGDRKATYVRYKQEIRLHLGGNRWALRELVVLHELAHHLTPGELPSHGPYFCRTFLSLGEQRLGVAVRDRLAEELRREGGRLQVDPGLVRKKVNAGRRGDGGLVVLLLRTGERGRFERRYLPRGSYRREGTWHVITREGESLDLRDVEAATLLR